MSEADEFLKANSGSKYPAWKFQTVGDTAKGTIIEEPKVVERPNLNDGHLEKQLIINLDPGDGNIQTLWVRAGLMAAAIQEAVAEAGAEGVQEGGRLAVQFSGTRPSKYPQPAKEFTAQYQAPQPSAVAVGDLL